MDELGYGEAPERQLTPAEVSAQARAIAAAEGIKYKSARRRIERRRTTGREFRGQPNRRFAAQVLRRGLRVSMEVEIDPSPGSKVTFRPRTIEVTIPGEDASVPFVRMVAALERSNLGEAERHFMTAVLTEYENGAGFLAESAEIGALVVGDVSAMSVDFAE